MTFPRARPATAATLYFSCLTAISAMTIILDGSTQRTRSYAFDFLALGLTLLVEFAVLLAVSAVFADIDGSEAAEVPREVPRPVIRLAA